MTTTTRDDIQIAMRLATAAAAASSDAATAAVADHPGDLAMIEAQRRAWIAHELTVRARHLVHRGVTA